MRLFADRAAAAVPGLAVTKANTVLTGTQATHDAVLAALPTGQWAHFACHGTSDSDNPSASCLLLTDHQQRPLTVTDVARLRLEDAGLAFLSGPAAPRAVPCRSGSLLRPP
ncbi:MAG: CHAT domain-containing protein [Streptosporangiaceae bacterium]